jgi:pimeloyl-ACP methyl ester carboxylesterase
VDLTSFDGTRIAYRVEGSGPDVLLLHGFAADAQGNWFGPGIAAAIGGRGRRVIAPDARGHGASDKPHDPAAYGDNAMVRDARALLDHLGVTAVDVVGYSMGSLVSIGVALSDPRTRSLVLGGVGERTAATRNPERRARIAGALEARVARGGADAESRAFRRFAERRGNDLAALAAIQRAQVVDNGERGALGRITVPTLVVAGADDRLAGSPDGLAARISGAVARTVPGDHLSAVGRPELAHAIVEFLERVSPV